MKLDFELLVSKLDWIRIFSFVDDFGAINFQ